MASCSLATLQEQACANGFLAADDKQAKALILVQLKNLTGSTLTLDQLHAQACANGFLAINEKQFRAGWLQFLCILSDGLRDVAACVNLIPANTAYSGGGAYLLTGLTVGANYSLTMGSNEALAINGIAPGCGNPLNDGQFISCDGSVLLNAINPDLPVTAIICEVLP